VHFERKWPCGGRDEFAFIRFSGMAKKLRSNSLRRSQLHPEPVHACSLNVHQGGLSDCACVALLSVSLIRSGRAPKPTPPLLSFAFLPPPFDSPPFFFLFFFFSVFSFLSFFPPRTPSQLCFPYCPKQALSRTGNLPLGKRREITDASVRRGHEQGQQCTRACQLQALR